MRRAAALPIQGPASSDVLAAGGGLDLPGRERPDAAAAPPAPDAAPHPPEIIPGAREADTLTHREPGAIGGQFTGMDIPPAEPAWVDDRTTTEHLREGGDARAHTKRER